VNGLFEGDQEETKAAEERMKRDMLAARVFDLRNEDEVYREEEEERERIEEEKKLEKTVRKALLKREKNFDYESDESNPYSSSSEDSDSEAERRKEAERKEEEEKAGGAGKGKEAEKGASGTSTKGTTTPSGAAKPDLLNKKKRPGSPNLSEASGNESARKKHKKKHDKLAAEGRKPSIVDSQRLNELRGAGSGSESEAGRIKKMKSGKSQTGTPVGSRAASPDAAAAGGSANAGASRAGSPTGSTTTSTPLLPGKSLSHPPYHSYSP